MVFLALATVPQTLTSVTVEGFGDTDTYKVELYTVDRSENRSQPQIAFPLGERPEAVVGIMVPLPFQPEVRAVIIALARFLGRVGKAVIGSHYL